MHRHDPSRVSPPPRALLKQLSRCLWIHRRWRQQRRLLHALELLSSGASVTAAALETGYDNCSAFIAMFRRCLGTTPLQYVASTGVAD